MEKQNAKQYPKIYYARHMVAGNAAYDNEVVYLSADTIKAMMPSFVGKPLYVHHVDDVDLKNLQETSHGYVLETFYNDLDGWIWSKFLAVDDIAHQAIANNWSVSNAYLPLESGAGGTYLNVPYDREILKASFTHLAIVPNPRYEDACIMTPDEYKIYCESKKKQLAELQNSKTEKKEGTFMKFFKREKVEVSVVDANTLIEIQNSNGEIEEVSVQHMMDALKNAKKNEDEKANMKALINVDGEEMTVEELSNRYAKLNKKKNEADQDAEKENAEAEDDAEKENAEDEEKENAEDDAEKEKTNAKARNFEQLKNAHNTGGVRVVDLAINQIERGKAYYG